MLLIENRACHPALPVHRSFFHPKSTFLFRLDILFALEILLGQDMLLCLESPPCPCLISVLIHLRLRSYPVEGLALLAPLPQSDSCVQRWPERLRYPPVPACLRRSEHLKASS
jgi:hypothetical protein